MKRDTNTAFCSVCGMPIHHSDRRYVMPDGDIVCDDKECLTDWAREYLCLGEVPLV